jgi:PPOX class probable F420-dependent enzyme
MMPDEARERFAAARVARLATVSADGRPHLVPLCFAVEGDTIFSAVDEKPKATTALARLRNIEAQERVSLLVDHYDDEDWTRLWWARADGVARVETAVPDAVALLRERYPQYRSMTLDGPVIVVDVVRWSGWSAVVQHGPGCAH